MTDTLGVIVKSWLSVDHPINISSPAQTDPIMVIGLPRSGTSRVAGILHLLGVYMASRFPATDELNPRGYFEDKDLTELVDFAQTGYITRDEFITVIKYIFINRKSLGTRWGFKTHRIVRYYDVIRDLCPDVKVILCTRDFQNNIDSIAKCYNMDRGTAAQYASVLNGEIKAVCDERLKSGHGILHIPLERSITENQLTVEGIIDFCELEGVLEESFAAANFYLDNYKDEKAWPLSKTISVPNWGRSDKVRKTHAELQRPIDDKLRTSGG
jgi:hypothetical protein